MRNLQQRMPEQSLTDNCMKYTSRQYHHVEADPRTACIENTSYNSIHRRSFDDINILNQVAICDLLRAVNEHLQVHLIVTILIVIILHITIGASLQVKLMLPITAATVKIIKLRIVLISLTIPVVNQGTE